MARQGVSRRDWLRGSAAAIGAAGAMGAGAQALGQEGGSEPSLAGQTILITGSSSGFGRLGRGLISSDPESC
jgi:hypothetical protein